METNEDVISNFVKHIKKRYLKDSPVTRRLSQDAAKILSELGTCNNHVMETKLNNNEVKEVARMQQMINSYQSFLLAIHFMIKSGEDINCPIYCNMDRKMQNIWRWVREHKDNK